MLGWENCGSKGLVRGVCEYEALRPGLGTTLTLYNLNWNLRSRFLGSHSCLLAPQTLQLPQPKLSSFVFSFENLLPVLFEWLI